MIRRLELLVAALLTVATFGGAWAEDEDLAWFREHQAEVTASLPAGVTVSLDETEAKRGKASFKVQYTGTEPVFVRLSERPAPNLYQYNLDYQAWIRAKNVQARAYIAMHCVSKDGTLCSRALNQAVQGTTDWQLNRTRYRQRRGGQHPTVIQLGLYMEGPGTVQIAGMTVHTYTMLGENTWIDISWPLDLVGLWYLLRFVLGRRGRSKAFIVGSGLVALAASVICALVSIGIAVTGKPTSAWLLPLVGSGMGISMLLITLPEILRRYREAETRRTSAVDPTDEGASPSTADTTEGE